MDTFWQDVRYAVRMLVKARGMSIVALLTLALGIGANTAVFTAVNAVLLRPLPFAHPDRLANVWISNPAHETGLVPLSVADFLDWRAQNRAFEHLAAYSDDTFNLTAVGEPEELRGAWVTAEFFPALGIPPALGRTFVRGDDEPGRERMVVLGHRLWQRRFRSDPGIIGRAVMLDGFPRTVIGVMPPSFHFPPEEAGGLPGQVELWTVLRLAPPPRRGPYFLRGLGRVQSGVGLEQVRAELAIIAQRIVEANRPGYTDDFSLTAIPLKESLVGEVRPVLWMLLGAVGLVLLIASANVGNLVLARAIGREREMAVRAALGAGRARIVRQLLTESLVLALLGGALGVVAAYWGVQALVALSPQELPRLDEVRMDGRVLGFAWLASLLSGLLFGLAPALQVSRGSLSESIKEGGRAGEGRGRQRLRNLLVVSEVALSLVLLVGGGLLLNSLVRLLRTSPGFEPQNILTTYLNLSGARYPDDARVNAFYTRLLEQVAALPGVESVGIGMSLPPNQLSITDNFTVEGQAAGSARNAPAALVFVSPGYFQALGVPLLAGRHFDQRDREGAPWVVMINEAMARQYYPGQNPVGKRMKTGGVERPNAPWMEVVGVVGDIKLNGLDAEPMPTYYQPYTQVGWSYTYLVARTQADPRGIAPALRDAIWALDPDLPVDSMLTMDQRIRESVAAPRFRTLLLTAFSALGLVLAAVGIYGVMGYTVTQRTREIGIRVALGAQRSHILGLVVGQGMKLVLIGAVVGLGAAVGLTRFVVAHLYGVTPTDPVTYAGVAVVLGVVALAACLVPARRAVRVEPVVALRHE